MAALAGGQGGQRAGERGLAGARVTTHEDARARDRGGRVSSSGRGISIGVALGGGGGDALVLEGEVQVQVADLRSVVGGGGLADVVVALARDLEGAAAPCEDLGLGAGEGVGGVEGELGAVALGGAGEDADGQGLVCCGGGCGRGGGGVVRRLEAPLPQGFEGDGAGSRRGRGLFATEGKVSDVSDYYLCTNREHSSESRAIG